MTAKIVGLDGGTIASSDDDELRILVRFQGENVLVDLNGSGLRPRHMFAAAAILTRLANKTIDNAEMAQAMEQMQIASVARDMQKGKTQ